MMIVIVAAWYNTYSFRRFGVFSNGLWFSFKSLKSDKLELYN